MNQEAALNCWHCGAELARFPKPYSRREVCRACEAELHVCRMCRHYDAAISDQCREDRAEPPSDKQRANFCDYFEPAPGAYQGTGNDGQAALDQLNQLFGEAPSAPAAADSVGDDALDALNALFGSATKKPNP